MIGKITFLPDQTIIIDNGSEIISYRYASFGARFVARLIDVVIIILPNSIIPLIPGWLYWGLQQSGKKQSTVGQNAMGIKTMSTDGTKISFGQASGRFFANFLNILSFFIGYLMFFFGNKKQCLHDYLSGCIVVEEVSRNNYMKTVTEENIGSVPLQDNVVVDSL